MRQEVPPAAQRGELHPRFLLSGVPPGCGVGRPATRARPDIADYVLVYRNQKLAVVEAKAWDKLLTEAVGQAKSYAGKLAVRYAYSTNGQGIYGIDMTEGTEGEVPQYPTPEELWNLTFAQANAWRDRFAAVPFEDRGGGEERSFRRAGARGLRPGAANP